LSAIALILYIPNVTAANLKWGLLITFTSLLKQDRYKFWTMPFVKKAPEVPLPTILG
jgi:hypothetical protein